MNRHAAPIAIGRSLAMALAAALAVAPAAAPAFADPPDDAAAALSRGIAAYRAGDFARAHDELLDANRLAPERPEPYRWLALAEAELDDCQSALLNVDAFLSRVAPADPGVPQLVALRDRCQRTGKIDIDSAPRGASIHVDGGPEIATTPAHRLVLPVGPHTIRAEKPGFAGQSMRIDVRPFGPNYAILQLTAEQHTRLVQRWWFWVAVGAAAITVGALTFDSGDSSPSPTLPPVTCTATGCHP